MRFVINEQRLLIGVWDACPTCGAKCRKASIATIHRFSINTIGPKTELIELTRNRFTDEIECTECGHKWTFSYEIGVKQIKDEG